jgi:uncharacterized protein (TIGR00266 family)
VNYKVLHPGSNAVVHVTVQPGDKIMAESGSLVARSRDLKIVGRMWGGLGGSLRRQFLGGESFVFQEITCEYGGNEVVLAPRIPGDIKILELEHGEDYFVRSGALLAAMGDVHMDVKAQKLSAGIFSGAGFFVLNLKGQGHIIVSSFGAVMEIPIPVGDHFVIDNNHLVAWSGDTSYKMVKAASSWGSSFLTGGGFACEFEGPGRVWIQTRSPSAFGAYMSRFMTSRRISLIG